jgi:hypothetical protein
MAEPTDPAPRTAVFDVNEELAKFFQVRCGYLRMSEEELGIDTFVVRKDGELIVFVPESTRRGKKWKIELDPEPLVF